MLSIGEGVSHLKQTTQDYTVQMHTRNNRTDRMQTCLLFDSMNSESLFLDRDP